ncbi:hypothetical protein C8R45DRAFT_942832 [Mycena sanguinolenta]|nr:hypothetical protein C8R45DRAFT_942832 [Mycena sanguinolenta]
MDSSDVDGHALERRRVARRGEVHGELARVWSSVAKLDARAGTGGPEGRLRIHQDSTSYPLPHLPTLSVLDAVLQFFSSSLLLRLLHSYFAFSLAFDFTFTSPNVLLLLRSALAPAPRSPGIRNYIPPAHCSRGGELACNASRGMLPVSSSVPATTPTILNRVHVSGRPRGITWGASENGRADPGLYFDPGSDKNEGLARGMLGPVRPKFVISSELTDFAGRQKFEREAVSSVEKHCISSKGAERAKKQNFTSFLCRGSKKLFI